jgi:hypothetical protein
MINKHTPPNIDNFLAFSISYAKKKNSDGKCKGKTKKNKNKPSEILADASNFSHRPKQDLKNLV